MPRQIHFFWRMPQRVSDLPRTTRNPGNLGDLPIVGDTTRGNIQDRFPNTSQSRFSIHLTQSEARLDLTLRVAQHRVAIQ